MRAAPGMRGGRSHSAGSGSSTMAADSWLPAASAIGGTPVRQLLVKLAAKP